MVPNREIKILSEYIVASAYWVDPDLERWAPMGRSAADVEEIVTWHRAEYGDEWIAYPWERTQGGVPDGQRTTETKQASLKRFQVFLRFIREMNSKRRLKIMAEK